MLINDAFAQAAEGAAASPLSGTLIQLGLIFLIFYFLLIRPQQKKLRQHEAMLSAVKKGDRVVTGGGIVGKVASVVSDAELEVEIAPGVAVKVLRSTVRELFDENAVHGKKPLPAKAVKAAEAKEVAAPGRPANMN